MKKNLIFIFLLILSFNACNDSQPPINVIVQNGNHLEQSQNTTTNNTKQTSTQNITNNNGLETASVETEIESSKEVKKVLNPELGEKKYYVKKVTDEATIQYLVAIAKENFDDKSGEEFAQTVYEDLYCALELKKNLYLISFGYHNSGSISPYTVALFHKNKPIKNFDGCRGCDENIDSCSLKITDNGLFAFNVEKKGDKDIDQGYSSYSYEYTVFYKLTNDFKFEKVAQTSLKEIQNN
jgi:hypothetical protein